MRLLGLVVLGLAAVLAWTTDWFHAERDVSRYPEIRLTYTTCRYEQVTHSRGATTRQLVFLTDEGRYVMEDEVWRKHFSGPALAAALAGGGTVRAWVHPSYPHTLRGIAGGTVDIPPEWGLDYDRRNMGLGLWVDGALWLAGAVLFFWRR